MRFLILLTLLTLLYTLAHAGDKSTCRANRPRIYTAIQRFCTTDFTVPSDKGNAGYTVTSIIKGDRQTRRIAVKSGSTCSPKQRVEADVCKRVFYGMCVRYADQAVMLQTFGGGCQQFTISNGK